MRSGAGGSVMKRQNCQAAIHVILTLNHEERLSDVSLNGKSADGGSAESFADWAQRFDVLGIRHCDVRDYLVQGNRATVGRRIRVPLNQGSDESTNGILRLWQKVDGIGEGTDAAELQWRQSLFREEREQV